MNQRDDDALEYLTKALNMGLDPESSLEAMLRAAAHAANILGNQQAAGYFQKQIVGFGNADEVNFTRRVAGEQWWIGAPGLPVNLPTDFTGSAANREFGKRSCRLTITAELPWIIACAKTGWQRPAPEVEPRDVIRSGRPAKAYPVEYYGTAAFIYSLNAIRQEAYKWVSDSIVYIKYGSRLTDIWQRHRAAVDAKIQEVGLTNHFASIDKSLGSDNPQDWRSAMFACRSLLDDMADYLWKDPSETYPPIKGRDEKGNKIDLIVTKGKSVNRLMAYMNEKADHGERTKLTSKQLSFLGDILFRVHKISNSAHESVSKDLAETTAIHTYLLISDLVRLTDMEPVEKATKY